MDRTRCPRCRQTTLVGLSNGGRAAALDLQLDVLELDPAGELDALHDGRQTWTLHAVGDAFARSAAIIVARPAGQGWRQTVHADHACRQGGQ